MLKSWLSRRRGAQTPDLVPRWKKFIESEPVIRPANVPPVKPLRRDSEFDRLLKGAANFGQLEEAGIE